MQESALIPLAHLAHWAALLYAAPVILLGIWAGVAKLRESQRQKVKAKMKPKESGPQS